MKSCVYTTNENERKGERFLGRGGDHNFNSVMVVYFGKDRQVYMFIVAQYETLKDAHLHTYELTKLRHRQEINISHKFIPFTKLLCLHSTRDKHLDSRI